jgi:3-(methylthio)propionyl---CoA ligase
VTLSLGVPTIWLGFAAHLEATGARCTTLRGVLSGGAAGRPALTEAFEDRGITTVQGWGMTEISPLGTVSALEAKHLALDGAGQRAIKAKAGRPVFGVEMKIADENGRTLPHDGTSVGEVMVRGPWIISGYFEDEEATYATVEADGWLHTGDVATIDADGVHADRRSVQGLHQVRRRLDQLD